MHLPKGLPLSRLLPPLAGPSAMAGGLEGRCGQGEPALHYN